MLAKDVLRVLGITRPTLTKYVKTGIIRVNVLPNKRYDYNEEDVYGFLNKKAEKDQGGDRGCRRKLRTL